MSYELIAGLLILIIAAGVVTYATTHGHAQTTQRIEADAAASLARQKAVQPGLPIENATRQSATVAQPADDGQWLRQLRLLVQNDSTVVARLLKYEATHATFVSPDELARLAVERWQNDNRSWRN